MRPRALSRPPGAARRSACCTCERLRLFHRRLRDGGFENGEIAAREPCVTWHPERALEIVAGTLRGAGLDRTARALARSIESLNAIDVPVSVLNMPGDASRRIWGYLDRHPGDAHVVVVTSPNVTTDYLTGYPGRSRRLHAARDRAQRISGDRRSREFRHRHGRRSGAAIRRPRIIAGLRRRNLARQSESHGARPHRPACGRRRRSAQRARVRFSARCDRRRRSGRLRNCRDLGNKRIAGTRERRIACARSDRARAPRTAIRGDTYTRRARHRPRRRCVARCRRRARAGRRANRVLDSLSPRRRRPNLAAR